MRTSYEFALVQLTRFRPVRGVLRTVSTDSIVLLRLRRMRNTHRITNLICSRKLGGCESAINSTAVHPKGTSYGDAEASPSGRSTQRQGDKRSAAADLIASNAPLRNGSHKARQNGPKHYPRGFKGPQPLGTPFSPIFRRATKDGVPEGPTEKRMPVNSQNKKTCPPEGLPKRECP